MLRGRESNYERSTRRNIYRCNNGVRQVDLNDEPPEEVELEFHAIRRVRRLPADREAEQNRRAEHLAAALARAELQRFQQEEIQRLERNRQVELIVEQRLNYTVAAQQAEAERMRLQQQQEHEQRREQMELQLREQQLRIEQMTRENLTLEQRALELERVAQEACDHVAEAFAATTQRDEAKRMQLEQQQEHKRQRKEMGLQIREQQLRIDQIKLEKSETEQRIAEADLVAEEVFGRRVEAAVERMRLQQQQEFDLQREAMQLEIRQQQQQEFDQQRVALQLDIREQQLRINHIKQEKLESEERALEMERIAGEVRSRRDEAIAAAAQRDEAERIRLQQQQEYKQQREAMQLQICELSERIEQITRDKIASEQRALEMERVAEEARGHQAIVAAAHRDDAEHLQLQQQQKYKRIRKAMGLELREQQLRIDQIKQEKLEFEQRALEMERAVEKVRSDQVDVFAAVKQRDEAERSRLQQQQDFEKQREAMQLQIREQQKCIDQINRENAESEQNRQNQEPNPFEHKETENCAHMNFHSTLKQDAAVASGSGLQNTSISTIHTPPSQHGLNGGHNDSMLSQFSSRSTAFDSRSSRLSSTSAVSAENAKRNGNLEHNVVGGREEENKSSDAPDISDTMMDAMKDILDSI